jgi:DNA-binding MarR family transcriptional regulator
MVATGKKRVRVKRLIPGMDEILELDWLFGRSRYLTLRAREKELQRYNLTPEQVHTLLFVRVLGNKGSQSQVGRLLVREPHSTADIINRMAKKGLVIRAKDMEPKNLVRVAITKKGEKALKLSKKAGPTRRILYVLNKEERIQFRNFLERIMAKAEEELGINKDNLPASDFEPPIE